MEVIISNTTKVIPYTYSDVKETLQSWIFTNIKVIEKIHVPIGTGFPYTTHQAVVQIKLVGFNEFFKGNQMNGFISQAVSEYNDSHPELIPGTNEHKELYPDYYKE